MSESSVIERLNRQFAATMRVVAANMVCQICRAKKPVRVIRGGVPRSRWCEDCLPGPPRTKHTYEFVRRAFEAAGCVLLAERYVDNQTPMAYLCCCGRYSEVRFYSFQMGARCQSCGVVKARRTLAAQPACRIDRIRAFFSDRGCVLRSTVCRNSSTPLEWECSCGNRSPRPITLGEFQRGRRCWSCKAERARATLARHRAADLSPDLASLIRDRSIELAAARGT